MAGVVVFLIIMTVLEVRAALAPTLHWVACLSRRLAAVFRRRQVCIMKDSVDDSYNLVLATQVFHTSSSDPLPIPI